MSDKQNKTYRVLVTGSRNWRNVEMVEDAIRDAVRTLGAHPHDVVLVHGDAQGLDRIASGAASRMGMQCESHPAQWNRDGRAAGVHRNTRMVALGADITLVFPTPSSSGTWDCYHKARRAGIPTVVIREDDSR